MIDIKYYLNLSLKDRQAYLRNIAKNRVKNKLKENIIERC